MDTINETSVVCPEFVIGNHFTDKSKNELSRVWFFLLLLEKVKHYRENIEDYMSNFKIGVEPL